MVSGSVFGPNPGSRKWAAEWGRVHFVEGRPQNRVRFLAPFWGPLFFHFLVKHPRLLHTGNKVRKLTREAWPLTPTRENLKKSNALPRILDRRIPDQLSAHMILAFIFQARPDPHLAGYIRRLKVAPNYHGQGTAPKEGPLHAPRNEGRKMEPRWGPQSEPDRALHFGVTRFRLQKWSPKRDRSDREKHAFGVDCVSGGMIS